MPQAPLLPAGYFTAGVAQTDPVIAQAIEREKSRTHGVIELIASENIVSRAVLDVQGSILTNKTVEGYAGKRYHAGAVNVDVVERTAIERACKLFGCAFANVQPHSGSQANHAVLHAVAQPGDTILSMDLNAGGHLSHGASVNFSGTWFNVVHYGVNPHSGLIDYDEVVDLARRHQPKLVIAGGSAYPRALDFAAFRRAADAGGAKLLVDMAHFAGLVAGGAHEQPFPHADIVTTTTYKSLRGPRGAIILWNDEALRKRINNAVFPGLQGTPSLQIVAAKAVALGEALQPEFAAYAAAVLANARTLAARLQHHGYTLVGGGTDTPLMLVDLRSQGLTGAPAAQSLERAGIIANMNPIPSDAVDLKVMSGLRFGVSGATTRGLGVAQFEAVGDLIAEVLQGLRANPQDNSAVEASVAARVAAIAACFATYERMAGDNTATEQ
jgi:glycine hydroxymethyltransferase